MNDLTAFQAQAATMALHKLMRGSYFCISTFDQIAKMIGKDVGGIDYMALRSLHCVHYAEMPEQLRQQVRDKTVELLGLPPMVIDAEPTPPEQTQKSVGLKLAFWKRSTS